MPYPADYGAMGQQGLGMLRRPGQAPDPMQQQLGGFLQQQRRQRPPGGQPGQGGQQSLLDMLPGIVSRHPLGGLGGGGGGMMPGPPPGPLPDAAMPPGPEPASGSPAGMPTQAMPGMDTMALLRARRPVGLPAPMAIGRQQY